MCPVSGGALLAATVLSSTASAFTVAAVSAIGAAAIGAAIGVGIGGVVNLATGRGFFDGAGKAALFGAIGGGLSSVVSSGAAAVGNAASESLIGASITGGEATTLGVDSLTALQTATEVGAAAGNTTSFIVGTGLTAVGSALTPEPFGLALPQASQQDFSGGQVRTTGSGGSQAAVSLAEAVARTKQRKLSQADVSSLSVDTSSFASGGLQFA